MASAQVFQLVDASSSRSTRHCLTRVVATAGPVGVFWAVEGGLKASVD